MAATRTQTASRLLLAMVVVSLLAMVPTTAAMSIEVFTPEKPRTADYLRSFPSIDCLGFGLKRKVFPLSLHTSLLFRRRDIHLHLARVASAFMARRLCRFQN